MAWYDDAWAYRVKLTIASSQVDADLTDFPVYVDLSDLPSTFFDNVQSDGGDIRVTKSDETTEVARQVVDIDTVGDTGQLHFEANGTLSSSSDTDFYIYYGNPGASEYAADATYGSENVWDANYLGVWHLEEDPSGTAPQLLDSTSNGLDLTTAGTMTGGDSVAAVIENGIDFDGSNDDARSSSNTGLTNTDSRTVSCWAKLTATAADADPVTGSGATGGGNMFNIVTGVGGNGYWSVRTGTSGGSGNDLSSTSSSSSDVSSFVFLVAKYNGTTLKLRRNDAEIATGSRTLTTSDGLFRLAEGPQATRNPPVVIDEVRLSDSHRSDEWNDAEYVNQNTPGTFYTVASEEEADIDWYDTSWLKRIKITVNSDEVDADLTDFPVYVDLSELDSTFFDDVKSDGGDIRMTKADGTTEVAREVVAIDTVGDTGELHFIASGTLSSAQGTSFYIYYKNSGASEPAEDSTYGAENAWTTYAGIWHMQEDPSGSAPQILDSTSNDNDGTSNGSMTSGDSVAGKLAGNALDFDGTNDYINCDVNATLDVGSGDFTYSSWFKLNNTGNNWFGGSGSAGAGGKRYGLTVFNGEAYVIIDDNTTQQLAKSGTTGVYDDNLWHHCAGVRDGTDLKLYVDGTLAATTAIGAYGSLDDADGMALGVLDLSSPTNYMQGVLDEERVSVGTAMSADWLSTEFNNQASPATFFSMGSPEDVPTSDNAIFFGCNF